MKLVRYKQPTKQGEISKTQSNAHTTRMGELI